RVGKHAADLGFVRRRVAQPALLRKLQQLVVRPLTPQEKGEPPSQLQIIDEEYSARREIIIPAAGLDPIQELGARENRHQAFLQAVLEAVRASAQRIERGQRREIGLVNGPSKGAASKPRQYVLRAGQLVPLNRRIAAEDALPGRRRLVDPC